MEQVSSEGKQKRDKIVRTVVWVVVACLFVLLLPAFVATVWTPSCISCHNDDSFSEQTATSAHSAYECTVCHGGQKGSEAVLYREKVMYQMVFPVFKRSPTQLAFVPNKTCEMCHDEVLGQVTTSNGIKIKHAVCALGANCVDCHSTTAHGTGRLWPSTYDMDSCLRCHVKEGVSTKKGCESCHDGKYEAKTPITSPYKATHGDNWEKTHGMGSQDTCMACHPSDYCTPCHGEGVPHDKLFISRHGTLALNKNNKCETCHPSESFCNDCHGIQMPHEASFLKKHSGIVKKSGDTNCLNCHLQKDCDSCHTAHVHPGGAS